MPFASGPTSPDAQIATLRRINAGKSLDSNHPVASMLAENGHVEHDGDKWSLTDAGTSALASIDGSNPHPAASGKGDDA